MAHTLNIGDGWSLVPIYFADGEHAAHRLWNGRWVIPAWSDLIVKTAYPAPNGAAIKAHNGDFLTSRELFYLYTPPPN